jgi:hypothetical protein
MLPNTFNEWCYIIIIMQICTYLHSNNSIDEEEHSDQQTDVRQRLEITLLLVESELELP